MVKKIIVAIILFVAYKIIKWILYIKKCENYWIALYNLQREYENFFKLEGFELKEQNIYDKNKIVEHEYIKKIDIQQETFEKYADSTTLKLKLFFDSLKYKNELIKQPWSNQEAYKITLIIKNIETKIQVLNTYNETEKIYKISIILKSEL